MKQIKVERMDARILSYVNDDGYRVVLPVYERNGEWLTFGACQVYGVSKSDSQFASVHALPYRWRPKGRILAALRRSTTTGGH
jgi:hypothetical protein